MKILRIAAMSIVLQFVISQVVTPSLAAQLLEAKPIEAGAPDGTVVERIVYLSDGLRVAGYRASPVQGADLPVIIYNRLVKKAHFEGGTFSPMISTFTIDELKSTGDFRLPSNESLKWQMADYHDQIGLPVDKWMTWGDEGITETYFRELALVLEPEPRRRDRAGTDKLRGARYRLSGHRQP